MAIGANDYQQPTFMKARAGCGFGDKITGDGQSREF
jgi:hypothetical protein